MIFNRRKPISKQIDGVDFIITPLDSYQQIDFLSIIDDMADDPKALLRAVEWVFDNVITDIVGLTDDAGNTISKADYAAHELTKGLNVGALREIIDAVVSTGQLDDDKKKTNRGWGDLLRLPRS